MRGYRGEFRKKIIVSKDYGDPGRLAHDGPGPDQKKGGVTSNPDEKTQLAYLQNAVLIMLIDESRLKCPLLCEAKLSRTFETNAVFDLHSTTRRDMRKNSCLEGARYDGTGVPTHFTAITNDKGWRT